MERVVLCGVQTPNCIRATAYDAVSLDYRQVQHPAFAAFTRCPPAPTVCLLRFRLPLVLGLLTGVFCCSALQFPPHPSLQLTRFSLPPVSPAPSPPGHRAAGRHRLGQRAGAGGQPIRHEECRRGHALSGRVGGGAGPSAAVSRKPGTVYIVCSISTARLVAGVVPPADWCVLQGVPKLSSVQILQGVMGGGSHCQAPL